eukprot:4320291-Pyramimonas_sp.AAC.1
MNEFCAFVPTHFEGAMETCACEALLVEGSWTATGSTVGRRGQRVIDASGADRAAQRLVGAVVDLTLRKSSRDVETVRDSA